MMFILLLLLIALVTAVKVLEVRYRRELKPVTVKEESLYEITSDNIDDILDWQMAQALHGGPDHPAIALRKAQAS